MSARPVIVDVERVVVDGPSGALDPAGLEASLPDAIRRELSVELPGDASADRAAQAVETAIARAIEGESVV
jgi:hypothetical protein